MPERPPLHAGQSSGPAIVPTAEVHDDPHQVALWRLNAVAQYLYDTMNGDADSDRERPDPLPLMAMEPVREAQRLLDVAIKHGQRTRRSTICGELELREDWKLEWCECGHGPGAHRRREGECPK